MDTLVICIHLIHRLVLGMGVGQPVLTVMMHKEDRSSSQVHEQIDDNSQKKLLFDQS